MHTMGKNESAFPLLQELGIRLTQVYLGPIRVPIQSIMLWKAVEPSYFHKEVKLYAYIEENWWCTK